VFYVFYVRLSNSATISSLHPFHSFNETCAAPCYHGGKMKSLILAALLACLSAPACLVAQAADSTAARQAAWVQDIDAFVQCFSAHGFSRDVFGSTATRGEIDFEKLYPQKNFKAQIAALKQSIPARSDAEIVIELARIVASAHVAHTAVQIPMSMGFERTLPVDFGWFSDGMIVFAATPAYKQTLGLRVLRLGSMSPEDLEKTLAPFISCENEPCLRARVPMRMVLRPVLDALHLIDADGCVSLTLDRPGETPLELRLPFFDNPRPMIPVWTAFQISSPVKPTETQRNRNYWYRYFPSSQTAYIQYRVCAEDPRIAFAQFVSSMMADLDTKPVRRVVIDLSANMGGDSAVIHPLLDALKTHPQWNGKIYVLIGPATFSAAVMNAIVLKLKLHATLVGEPTGGKPASYGEVNSFTLPNSKLVIQFSTRYFAADKGMEGPSLFPDIAAPLTIADFLAGRDPAFTAAIQASAQN
jgi:hypothetical protein